METRTLKIAFLAALLIGLPVAFVAGNWYWSSQNFTHTVVVDGNIDAKTNFIPADALATGPSYVDLVTSDNLIQLVEDGDY